MGCKLRAMKCPQCGNEWTPDASEIAAEFGRRTSKAKARAAKRNAKLGGWPKGKKRGKRKNKLTVVERDKIARLVRGLDPNQLAHRVVQICEKVTQQGQSPRSLKVLPSLKAPKRAH